MMESKTAHPARPMQELVLTALFAAIILLMAFTPLGLIDLPLIKATILHVPVIIGSVVLGPKRGAGLGALFGLVSLWKNTMAPSLLSFAFSPFVPLPGTDKGSLWALLICLVPRILTGAVPWFVFAGMSRLAKGRAWGRRTGFVLAGIAGAAVNTVLVMGLMGLVLGEAFAAAQGISHTLVSGAILSIMLANGIPEAIAAAVLCGAVCAGLDKARVIPNREQEEKA